MIDVQKLCKFYGSHRALNDISFVVDEGQTVGFLGPNGAGKSTTMRILTGFLTPTSGSVKVAGCELQSESIKARRKLGYLPESTPLYRDMRVHEFLKYRARLKGIGWARRATEIGEAMEQCRIADVSCRIIGQLSKGYRQRVGLADCLLGKPPLLILDEPTVGLDPNQVLETRTLIQEIGENRTVFLSTHILQEVERVCSHIIIINQGSIIAQGSPQAICDEYVEHRDLRLHVFADENPAPAVQELKAVYHVHQEDMTPEGAYHLRVQVPQGQDVRRELAELINAKHWLLQEMSLVPVRLEEIFAQLTVGQRG